MTVIDKAVSPRSVIDDYNPAHFFTNSLSAVIYKFIACKLLNSLFVSSLQLPLTLRTSDVSTLAAAHLEKDATHALPLSIH